MCFISYRVESLETLSLGKYSVRDVQVFFTSVYIKKISDYILKGWIAVEFLCTPLDFRA